MNFLFYPQTSSQCSYKSSPASVPKLNPITPDIEEVVDIPPSPPSIKQEVDPSHSEYKEPYMNIADTLSLPTVSKCIVYNSSSNSKEVEVVAAVGVICWWWSW